MELFLFTRNMDLQNLHIIFIGVLAQYIAHFHNSNFAKKFLFVANYRNNGGKVFQLLFFLHIFVKQT